MGIPDINNRKPKKTGSMVDPDTAHKEKRKAGIPINNDLNNTGFVNAFLLDNIITSDNEQNR